MGASSWSYREKYRGDIASTLDALQAEVFKRSGFSRYSKTLADLWADEEFMTDEGTHSILDVYRLLARDKPGEEHPHANNMRPLTDDELTAAFDCLRPTLATFQEAEEADRLPFDAKWNGCCEGAPNRDALIVDLRTGALWRRWSVRPRRWMVDGGWWMVDGTR
ncbi:hypothetical protein KGQ19_24180 [Catenulispora sp. NL8]|uniref:Uncharacterized protein n=1 Tax=Catenulispora pinistramenti TaxID=2705254 RepID=A0ABS5KV78_9ACTN|nr:hypothetical protein [Catenulispora pinistramenti]MBS2549966.1 hypothetical protein [Catenulispora pinistramenti]